MMQHDNTCGHCGTPVNTGFNTCKACGAMWKAKVNGFHGFIFLACIFGWFVGVMFLFVGKGGEIGGVVVIVLATLLWRKFMRNPGYAWFR